MKLLKEYGPGVAALLVIGLARHLWGETGTLAAVILMMIVVMVTCIISFSRSRRRYRYCPQCGCGTVLGWRTKKIDARNRWIKVGSKWHYGGVIIKKIAVIRCPECGWEIDLGK